jgi:hypothetical protein
MESEHYMKHKHKEKELAIDPKKREWEYDGDGTKIYKVEAGKPHKTPYESN